MAGFAESFEKAFIPAADRSAQGALEAIREKIKADQTKAEEALQTSQNLAMVTEISKGADPQTQDIISKIIGMKHTKDTSKAVLDFAMSQAKDKKDFEQVMTQERYKSSMLGVTEVIKAMAERGGTFADGTPITPASLQDFGKAASDRILAGITQQQPGISQQMTQQGQGGSGGSMQLAEQGSIQNKIKNSGSPLDTPIRSKASFKAEEKAATDTATAEKTSLGTYRFLQQFEKSIEELRKFDPDFDKVGASGWLSRKQASIAEALDELPETSALKIQILPMANAMAREIEGGRVTDDDRKIYADSFANGVSNPNVTNMRLISQSILSLLDKGGNQNGLITKQLQALSKSDTNMFKGVIAQVLIEYPELASEIYGEGFEVEE